MDTHTETTRPSSKPTRDPLRRVHRDMRRTVEREGEEAPRVLYAFFDLFNALYFGGKLGDPLIMIAQTSSPRAMGDYHPRDVHGVLSLIRIAPATYKRGMRRVLAVLLHEMVHAWCTEVLGDSEDGYKGHGPKFAAKCNEIGGPMGWLTVAPKGRGGLARAEQWPHLPIVEGEDEQPARKARKPAPEPEPKAEGDGDGDHERGERERAPGRDEVLDVIAYLHARAAKLADGGKVKAARIVRNIAGELAKGKHVVPELS